MIRLQRKDGVEINIETFNDPMEVDRLLSQCLRSEAYARLKRELAEAEEIFFEFTGANKKELPRIRHYLVHLDSRPRDSVNLSTGNFVIIFYVDPDHLAAAQEMAKHLKSRFKNANDWEETTEHAIEATKLFQIPPMDILREGEKD
jgi:hypothetical protein